MNALIWILLIVGLYAIFGIGLTWGLFSQMPFVDSAIGHMVLWPAVLFAHFHWIAAVIVVAIYGSCVYWGAVFMGLT